MQNQKTPPVAHSINRDGQYVPGNGFKQPTPTTAIQNRGIFYHSIDRTDSANPIGGFAVLIGVVVIGALILAFVR